MSSTPPVTDSPWFWVMLFSLAALAGIATIGPKFERREQAIETKFHARERGLKREAAEPGAPIEQGQEPQWEPIFTVWPVMARGRLRGAGGVRAIDSLAAAAVGSVA